MQAPYTFNEKQSLLSQDELQNELDKSYPVWQSEKCLYNNFNI